MNKLFEMLTYARPHKGKTEEAFIAKYLDSVPGMRADAAGNRILTIGDAPVTLFSSHTDTVHRTDGILKVTVDTVLGHVYGEGKECLGTDDTSGVWLMLEMICYNIPGLYVFHRGEERGGIGSLHIADRTPELLNGIRHAVAFDRKGTESVITHQFGGRCCSETFALALAGALRMKHKSDPTGSFTDTANYTHLVPECTNLSVGYYSQHTANENQDYRYLEQLRDAVMYVPWQDLPAEREPQDDRYGYWRGMDDHSYYRPGDTSRRHTQRSFLEWEDAWKLVMNDPELAANLLVELNATYEEVEELHHYLRGDEIGDPPEALDTPDDDDANDLWGNGFHAPQYGRKTQ